MIENMDLSMVNWARAQFALTAMYHWLFVPITLGITWIIGTNSQWYMAVLHGKDRGATKVGQVVAHVVGLRLAEDGGHGAGKELLGDALHVVAVDEPEVGEPLDAQRVAQLVAELVRLDVEPGLLLNIHARDHVVLPSCIGGMGRDLLMIREHDVRACPERHRASKLPSSTQ